MNELLKRENNKGFTLIELLSTIIILSLVLSITSYAVISIIDKIRQNSYEVTINNVESNSNSYLLENKDRLFFIASADGKIEYQCITVKNLIDYGYLNDNVTNSPVSKDTNVSPNDYIYIERDATSKAILKNVYIGSSNSEYASICGVAINSIGDIVFMSVPDFNEWSQEKEITIIYKLKNLNDENTVNTRTYNYSYSGSSTLVEDSGTIKKIKVTSTGTVSANIKLDNKIIASDTKDISKIDRVKPIIEIGSGTSGFNNRSLTIPLKLTDTLSGVNYKTFSKEDIEVTKDGNIINNTTLNGSNGNYTLVINNIDNYENIILTIKENMFFDYNINYKRKYVF